MIQELCSLVFTQSKKKKKKNFMFPQKPANECLHTGFIHIGHNLEAAKMSFSR